MDSKIQRKLCGKCKQWKPVTDFWLRNTRPGEPKRYYSPCKKCREKRRRQYRKENPHKVRNEHLQKTFGLNLDEYKDKLLQQDGVCAICGRPETSTFRGRLRHLSVDHDHKTDKVRGLLCNDCNVALGWFHDDIQILRNAVHYLDFWLNK